MNLGYSTRARKPKPNASVSELATDSEELLDNSAMQAMLVQEAVQDVGPDQSLDFMGMAMQETATPTTAPAKDTAPAAKVAPAEKAPVTDGGAKDKKTTAPVVKTGETTPAVAQKVDPAAEQTIQKAAPKADATAQKVAGPSTAAPAIAQKVDPAAEQTLQKAAPKAGETAQKVAPSPEQAVQKVAPAPAVAQKVDPAAEQTIQKAAPAAVKQEAPAKEAPLAKEAKEAAVTQAPEPKKAAVAKEIAKEVPAVAPAAKVIEDPAKYKFPEGKDDEKAIEKPIERRQQEEALPALRPTHSTNQYEDFKDGKAFVQGAEDKNQVAPNDVKQGALGDCYLMAGMAAVARANPEAIRNLIKDNGDGTFEVTLFIRPNSYSSPKPVKTVIDARLATKRAGVPLYAGLGDSAAGVNGAAGADEMWPALLEKALAQQKGSYDLISGGNIGSGFQFHGATELFTGKREGYQSTASMEEDDILLELAAALEANKPATVDSEDMSADAEKTAEANKLNVYGNHAYAVEAVDIEKRTITLQNPWGSHHVKELTIQEFKKFYRGVRIGGK